MAADPEDREAEEGEWRFSLADIEQRTDGENGDGDGDGDGNVAGALSPDAEIEAGDIDVENAAFVLVGVVLAVLVVVGFANVLP